MKTYSELCALSSFEDRFAYLCIGGVVGSVTFGFERFLNQALYTSARWRRVRDEVIIRDNGCDLGVEGFYIPDCVLVHHINPLSIDDIVEENPAIFDPEFLICTSRPTHNAIHFGDLSFMPKPAFVERAPFDTCPWKGDDTGAR